MHFLLSRWQANDQRIMGQDDSAMGSAEGKGNKKDREVFEYVEAVGVSRDGRWVVIAGICKVQASSMEL
jgi:hypothetical protein